MKKNMILIIGLVLCGVILFSPARKAEGLSQRLAVKYLRAIAAKIKVTPDDAGLTPEQVDSLTKSQAATYILNNYPDIPVEKLKEVAVFWDGIKIMLYNDAVERRMVERLILLRQQFTTAYPNAIGLDSQTAKDIGRQLIPLLYGEVEDPNDL